MATWKVAMEMGRVQWSGGGGVKGGITRPNLPSLDFTDCLHSAAKLLWFLLSSAETRMDYLSYKSWNYVWM